MSHTKVGLAVVGLLVLPQLTVAAVPDVYTNDNFWVSEHDRPLSFSADALGNVIGVTETGKIFRQTLLNNTGSIRLYRFSIDEAFFFISDQGVIVASSDEDAVAKYIKLIQE